MKDMLETMYDAPGIGLAAPQIGVMLQVFVTDCAIKDEEPNPFILINPSIKKRRACIISRNCKVYIFIESFI